MSDIYRRIITGNLYEILFNSFHVDTKEQVVVYRSMKDGKVLVRGIERFNELFEQVKPE